MEFTMNRTGYIGYYYLTYLHLLMYGGIAYGITTCHFENSYGCSNQIPAEKSAMEGWRLHSDNQNSYAFASCNNNCVQYTTLLRGFQSMGPSKFDVNFCYYLSTLGGAVDTRDVQMRVIACGKNKTVPLSEGAWQARSVRITCAEPFDVGFEIHLGGALQRIALDQATVKDPFRKSPAIVCPEGEPSLFDLHPAIIETPILPEVTADSPVAGETAVLGDEFDPDDTAVAGNVSSQLPNRPPSASEKTTPSDSNSGQPIFDTILKFFEDLLENPLLLAEVLAIATVAICFMTISIHCFIWRKQRKSYKLEKARSFRAQRYLARDLSNSDMLLDMTVHDGSDGDFSPLSRSRSSSKATPPVDRAKLKATKHAVDRRATVSNGSPGGSTGSVSGDSDDTKPRPHPRTKSLPSRPANNYYETIDEVRKQALQPVQEGEGEDSKSLSHSLPSLVEKPPEPPKSRRTAKSCRDKGGHRSKKQKKQSKKQNKNDAKGKDSTITEEQMTRNGNDYENGGLKVPHVDGNLYDKLDRDSHSHPELVCDGCVQNGEMKRGERFSLNVDAARDMFQKKVQFRPRAFSQDRPTPDWAPTSPSLAQQNMRTKGGISSELNNKFHESAEERTYFTLEPIENQQNNLSNRSSSELSDDVITGSVDTLQEQIILSKNQTDSFKRSVSNEQKLPRPNSLVITNPAVENDNPKKNGIPTVSVESPINRFSIDSAEDPFADRTYQTLEPPKFNGQLKRAKSSEETFF